MPTHKVKSRWPQSAVERALRKLFPRDWTFGAKMPILEDVLVRPAFNMYLDFVDEMGVESWREQGPLNILSQPKAWRSAAVGVQRSTTFSKAPVPQLVPDGLSFDEHFAFVSANAGTLKFPMDSEKVVDLDVRFAAREMARNLHHLGIVRRELMHSLRELSERLLPLTEHLRTFQETSASAIAGKIHVALIAVLTLVLRWPDVHLASRFVSGFRIIGNVEMSNVFRPVETVQMSDACMKQALLDSAARTREEFQRRHRPSEGDDHCLEACDKDEKRGVAGPRLSARDCDEKYGVGGWAAVPRLDLLQGDKHRPIDDGRRGGHNACMSFAERLDLCGADQPLLHAKCLHESCQGEGVSPVVRSRHRLLSGSEDLPQAYRWIPVAPEDMCANIVAVFNRDLQQWQYQEVWGHLFGFASAVLNFNRWPSLPAGSHEARAWRALCHVLR